MIMLVTPYISWNNIDRKTFGEASRKLICPAMEVAVGVVVQAGRAGDVLGGCIEIPGMVIRNRVDINIGLVQRPSSMTNREIERTISSKTSEPHLNINITKWSRKCTHQVLHQKPIIFSSSRCPAELDWSLQRRIGTRRTVQERACSSNGILSILSIQSLPDCPDPIDLSVMYPKCGISWRDEQITTWVAANSVVPAAVDADTS